MEPKRVEFEGKTYEFPADATDDEIFAFLDGAPAESGESEVEDVIGSQPAAPAPSPNGAIARGASAALGRVASNVGGAVSTLAKPFIQSAQDAQRIAQGGGTLEDAVMPPIARRIGETVVDAGKSVVRRTLDRGAAAVQNAGRGDFRRAGRHAIAAIPIVGDIAERVGRTIEGGDTAGGVGEMVGELATAAVPSIVRAGGRAAKAVGRSGAGAILETANPAVQDAALRHRALPGLVRSGEARAAARQRAAGESTRAALGGAPGDTPMPASALRGGSARNAEWDRLHATRGNQSARKAAGDVVKEAATEIPNPTAATVFDRAQRSREAGASGMAAALDSDFNAAVSRALPAITKGPAAGQLKAAQAGLTATDEIAGVQNAYRGRQAAGPVDQAGLPNMKMRMAASSINRLLGPTAQGMFRVGQRLDNAVPAELLRAALLEQMLQGSH